MTSTNITLFENQTHKLYYDKITHKLYFDYGTLTTENAIDLTTTIAENSFNFIGVYNTVTDLDNIANVKDTSMAIIYTSGKIEIYLYSKISRTNMFEGWNKLGEFNRINENIAVTNNAIYYEDPSLFLIDSTYPAINFLKQQTNYTLTFPNSLYLCKFNDTDIPISANVNYIFTYNISLTLNVDLTIEDNSNNNNNITTCLVDYNASSVNILKQSVKIIKYNEMYNDMTINLSHSLQYTSMYSNIGILIHHNYADTNNIELSYGSYIKIQSY